MPDRDSELIIVLFGLEARDWDLHSSLLAYLNEVAARDEGTDPTFIFPKARRPSSRRVVRIEVRYDKESFRRAIDTEGAIVIYDGHSRYGQGPVFGAAQLEPCAPLPATSTQSPWQDHFRMGYSAVSVPCIIEIWSHCTNPAELPRSTPTSNFFPSPVVATLLRQAKGKNGDCATQQARRSLSRCYPEVAAKANRRGEETLKQRDYWKAWTPEEDKDVLRTFYSNKSEGFLDFRTIVLGGSADLDQTSLRCDVLFVNSCSSKRHFLPALLRRRAAVRDTNCVFFLTDYTASSPSTLWFVQRVLRGWDPRRTSGVVEALKFLNKSKDSGLVTRWPRPVVRRLPND